jgi:hypothetical protein
MPYDPVKHQGYDKKKQVLFFHDWHNKTYLTRFIVWQVNKVSVECQKMMMNIETNDFAILGNDHQSRHRDDSRDFLQLPGQFCDRSRNCPLLMQSG